MVGQFGGGKNKRTGIVDVAIIQNLHRKGVVQDFVADYGHVIVDECHHLSAFTFESVLRQIKAKYVLGLTATPTRKDGHHPIIYMQCGPIRFFLSSKKAARFSPFEHKVIPRLTNFTWNSSVSENTIHEIYAALVADARRNDMIVEDVRQALLDGRSPLLLTSRTEHLDYLAGRLRGLCQHVFVLKGGMRTRQRKQVAESLSLVAPSSLWRARDHGWLFAKRRVQLGEDALAEVPVATIPSLPLKETHLWQLGHEAGKSWGTNRGHRS